MIFGKLLDAGKKIVSFLLMPITGTLEYLKGLDYGRLIDYVGSKLSGTYDNIKSSVSESFTSMLDNVSTSIDNTKEAVADSVLDMAHGLSNTLSGAKDYVTDAMSSGSQMLSKIGSDIRDGVTTAFSDSVDFVSSTLSNIKGEILASYNLISYNIKKPFAEAVDYVSNIDYAGFFLGISESIDNALSKMLDVVTWPAKQVITFATEFDPSEVIKKVTDSIGSVFDEIVNVFSAVSESISNWFDSKIESVKNSWLGKGISSVTGFFAGEDETTTDVRGTNEQLKESSLVEESSSGGTNKETLEESGTISGAFSRAMEGFSNWWSSTNQGQGNVNGGSTVIAPSSTTVVNNNTHINGSTGTRNNDRTIRDTSRRNMAFN